MQAFNLHYSIIEDYKSYLQSFTNIKDEKIGKEVEKAFSEGKFLPEPLIQFNPSYKIGDSLDTLIHEQVIHTDLKKIFGDLNLFEHQVRAIRKGVSDKSFVVTSGTGSGKSLTYLASVFNYVLKGERKSGIKAILVYPMNALINSQEEEIKKYLSVYGERAPITFGKYTGQEGQEARAKLNEDIPDIILTNYMMLELIMTRNGERWIRDSIKEHLKFLVFDELHTYRGRQGADVSMLIRRINQLTKNNIVYIGTSATMASGDGAVTRKEAVVEVASRIFSKPFSTDQVIEETLHFCTNYNGQIPSERELLSAINMPINVDDAVDKFLNHSLAIWIENNIALKRVSPHESERNKPMTVTDIARQLSIDSGETIEKSKQAVLDLLRWTEVLNIKGSKLKPRQSYIPFKIHQFISQTGGVYVTLDSREEREITLDAERYIKKVNGEEKIVFPVVFSRYSGYDYICVTKNFEENKLEPREFDDLPTRITREDLKGDREEGLPKRTLTEKDFEAGYVILNVDEEIWSSNKEENLPESWFKTSRGITRIDNYYEFRLPRKIYFNRDGKFSSDPIYPLEGWFIPAKLLFDPTSGIIFDLKTAENTKLMRLGNEGRSTATTITSFSILKAQNEQGIGKKNQKLLSFTDNRQDASLQAGHFNDFMMLGRLRSSIYHALRKAEGNILSIDNISEKVFQELNLPETEYARNPSPDPSWPEPENQKSIKDYILIRLLYDLKRGWRYNTPNLEQCGLLTINYNRLTEFCQRDDFWRDIILLDSLKPEEREKIIVQVLNFFRTSYALDYYKLNEKRQETEERLKNRLDSSKVWSLDEEEKIDIPYILIPKSVGETNYRTYVASIGPSSYLGKYFKRLFSKYDLEFRDNNELTEYIIRFCNALHKGHFLKPELVRGKKAEVTGYRIRVDNILWKLGDGKTLIEDEIRISSFRPYQNKPNEFFKSFYSQDFTLFAKSLIGREHTGQLNNADRIDREGKFRQGEISALYCSPTMELGIDISELNVVHMRNVPPNPANYAQRSGRAGRSGQAALVFTYCSNWSPHDRNYFEEKEKMVAGSVVPARMDLTNEELLLSHFNAFTLMELRLGSLKDSVKDILNVSLKELSIKEDIQNYIHEQINLFKKRWIQDFREVLSSIPELKNAFWFSDSWLEVQANTFYQRFDKAFDRWRTLYRNAEAMISRARVIIDDPTIQADKKYSARRDENVGISMRNLLLNTEERSYGNESEFYVFRYLASEGFLPGYNFTRLPVRAFLGYRHMDRGEFISRPRFEALKEFGPQNLIYHNGGKYRITKMQLNKADERLQTLKISKQTGYAFLNDAGKGVNNDPITHQELKGEDYLEVFNNLVELNESEARPQDRISCEEEERTRTGYVIDQYFSFPKGIASTKAIVVKEGDQPLLNLIYCQSARLLQVNRKWRLRKDDQEDFSIGRASGRWKKASDVDIPDSDDPTVNVKIFTTDDADILYIQPIAELKLTNGGVVTMSYALKRTIERQFQVEEGEVGVRLMGSGDSQNILIYEASEGSLGILSQIVSNGQLLKNLFVDAYKLLHFDLETKKDLRPDLPKASYDDLLSYYNQRHHGELDRYAVQKVLERLIECKMDTPKKGRNLEEQYKYLLEKYDLNSSTEKPLLEYLYKNGIQLPDEAQVNIPGYYISVDFVYKTDSSLTLIFCDGSVHDKDNLKKEDKHKRQLLRDAGYDVIEWHYMESKEALVLRRKDVFRKVNDYVNK